MALVATRRNTNIYVLVAAFLAPLTTGGPTHAFGLYGSTLQATALSANSTRYRLISQLLRWSLSWIPGCACDGDRNAMMIGGTLSCLSLLWHWVVLPVCECSHHLIVPALSALGVLIHVQHWLLGIIYKVILLCCGPEGPREQQWE
jgi:hypothetical protein